MMKRLRECGPAMVLAVAVMFCGLPAAAAKMSASAAELGEQLDGLAQLHAEFEQIRYDEQGNRLQRSRGEFWAQRPDRFRWHVDAPFEELLVGDGESLWLWDPDLEQVTVRPYDRRLQSTPASLLSGSVDRLLETFTVEHRERDDELHFVLRPVDDKALFDRLELIFRDALPRWLIIHDSMGQVTEVMLSNVQTEFAEDPERFRFQAPEGADVFHEGAHDSD